MRRSLLLLSALLAATRAGAAGFDPMALHPENPHYFLWRGKPTILITSGEHYGAVLNRAFDFKKYLATLQSDGLNRTRAFSGAYCESASAFNIERNTLAPTRGDLICPWARSDVPGYVHGGNKFDLTRWDPAYFQRLTEFIAEAGQRGVVVELVLSCPFYEDSMWQLSPMNSRNNLDGLALALPPGSYNAEWVSTKTGQVEKEEAIKHEGGTCPLQAPPYVDDIALRIHRLTRNRGTLLFISDFEEQNLGAGGHKPVEAGLLARYNGLPCRRTTIY